MSHLDLIILSKIGIFDKNKNAVFLANDIILYM